MIEQEIEYQQLTLPKWEKVLREAEVVDISATPEYRLNQWILGLSQRHLSGTSFTLEAINRWAVEIGGLEEGDDFIGISIVLEYENGSWATILHITDQRNIFVSQVLFSPSHRARKILVVALDERWRADQAWIRQPKEKGMEKFFELLDDCDKEFIDTKPEKLIEEVIGLKPKKPMTSRG